MEQKDSFFGRAGARLHELVTAWRARPFFLPAAGCFLALAVFVWAFWAHANPGISGASRFASLLSAGLFTVVCVEFLWKWLGDWMTDGGDGPAALPAEKPGWRESLSVFFALVILQAGVFFFVFVLRMALRGDRNFIDSLSFWTVADSQHYLGIAENWYTGDLTLDRRLHIVFLPGYPLVIRLFYPLFHNYLYAGLFASSLCFAGAGTVLYRLALLDMDRETALRALRFACTLPGAVFYAAPMGESLFLLLSVSSFYLMRKRLWLPACLVGGLAAFTRSLGLMLIVPLGYELLTDTLRNGAPRGVPRRVGQFLCLLLIPAGFGAYCLICKQITGNAFQWMIYQREHWNQRLGLFFNTASYQTQEALNDLRSGDFETLLGLWLPNLLCAFAALGVMIPGARRLRASYVAYFIPYFVMAIGPTWLLSAPRYLLVLFPTAFALAELTRSRRADGLVTVVLTGASVLYALMFVARWQVW